MLDKGKLQSLYKKVTDEMQASTGMGLAKRIEQLFKDRCAEFKKQYKLNFGVYYTPQEYQWAV